MDHLFALSELLNVHMEDCENDLWDMYHDYIEGKREIAEINAAFVEGE